ncbi:chorismate synthase [Methylophilaceae bacterium]|nr:chorismate synthase [Methylophilaceae bacterium]
MSGNSIGKNFTLTTFGESHGVAIGGIIDGCPPGLEISEHDLQIDLNRRKPGSSKFVTQRKESDKVQILSGVFEGKTTGTPIALIIYNEDQRSKDYSEIKDTFRPGHADITYQQKYGIRDYRGGGRSSARETAIRVAAGAIAKKWLLKKHKVKVQACIKKIGEIDIPFSAWKHVNQNPFFVPNIKIIPTLEDYINQIRSEKDSVGALVHVQVANPPKCLGEPIFDRLDADIAHAMMSINAVKGVEIGAGFLSVEQRGSVHSDEIIPDGFSSNNSGGILGGISTGQTITANVAFKPTSSIPQDRHSINRSNKPVLMKTKGRHDPCVAIRAVPIVEAMMALVLMDHLLRDVAQNYSVKRK